MGKKWVLVLLLFYSLLHKAKAQESELDPVTITASLNPAKASLTGRNLVVIKGERFAQLPVHSLDELLRYVPGIEVQSRGPLGAQSDIVIRGGTFQQVLVIIDGVRVNDPNTGHFTSYIPIAPTEIDRIEILKGASSAPFGSDAVGGVINVITKTFAAKREAKKLDVLGRLTAGEYRTFIADAGIFKNNGRTAWSFGGQSLETNGQPQRGIRGFVKSKNLSGAVSHFFNDKWQLALRSSYDKRKFAAQNFYTSFVSDTAQETVSSFWNQLQLSRSVANNTLRLQIGYKALQDSFSFNPKTSTNQSKSRLGQALLTSEWQVTKTTALTIGGQFINKKISSNDRGEHSINSVAAFVVVNQKLGSHFFIAPAVRLEYNEISKTEVVPQLNLSYRTAKLQLRASAGKTVRDADFTERYNNYNKTLVTSGQRLGNPDLKAERSFSYEGGTDYFVTTNLKLSGSVFQRYHKKLIDYVVTPYSQIPRKINLLPTGVYALAKNIAEVTTTGFETDIQFSKQISTRGSLWATVGFVWLNSKSSDTVPSFYISSHAKLLTNFNLQYTQKMFSISLNGLYKKRQPQKAASPLIAKVSTDYIVFNAKAEAFILKSLLSAFVEVDNIGNRIYADLLGAQMPGRWLMSGIKISLSK